MCQTLTIRNPLLSFFFHNTIATNTKACYNSTKDIDGSQQFTMNETKEDMNTAMDTSPVRSGKDIAQSFPDTVESKKNAGSDSRQKDTNAAALVSFYKGMSPSPTKKMQKVQLLIEEEDHIQAESARVEKEKRAKALASLEAKKRATTKLGSNPVMSVQNPTTKKKLDFQLMMPIKMTQSSEKDDQQWIMEKSTNPVKRGRLNTDTTLTDEAEEAINLEESCVAVKTAQEGVSAGGIHNSIEKATKKARKSPEDADVCYEAGQDDTEYINPKYTPKRGFPYKVSCLGVLGIDVVGSVSNCCTPI